MKNKKDIKNTQNGEAQSVVPNKEFLGSDSQKNDKQKRRTVMLVRKIMVIIMIALFSTTAMPAFAADADGFDVQIADEDSVDTAAIIDGTIDFEDFAQNGATNGQAIVWNNGAGQWEPQSIGGGSVAVGDITLTQHRIIRGGAGGMGEESSTPTTGQVLTFNGTSTDFRALDETNISGTANIPFSALASLTEGSILIGDNSNDASELTIGGPNELLISNGTTLAYGTIGSANITNNSITSDDIGTGAVGSDEIINESITSGDILNNTITSDDIGTGAVGGDEIIDNSVSSTEITNGTIVAADIEANFLQSITLWEEGTNGTYEDGAAVVVGTDAAFTYVAGSGAGDFKVADDAEVGDDFFVGGDTTLGANGSGVSAGLTTLGFTVDGEDLHVEDDVGIEGNLYVEGTLNLANPIVSTATVTKNMFLDLHGAVRNSAKIGTLSGGLTPAIKFDNGTNSTAIWTFPVPDDYSTGDINVKIAWASGGASATDVVWDYKYKIYDPNAGVDMTAALTNPADVTTTAPATANTSTESVLPITGVANDRNIILFLERPTGDANPNDASVIGVEIEYTAEQIQAN